jgi:hypothetical protein
MAEQASFILDAIVASSAEVGNLENFSLTFMSIVQYLGNAKELFIKILVNCLESHVGWFGNNSEPFENRRNFWMNPKLGGFVRLLVIGFDVSTNPIHYLRCRYERCYFTGALTTGSTLMVIQQGVIQDIISTINGW